MWGFAAGHSGQNGDSGNSANIPDCLSEDSFISLTIKD